MKLHKNHKKAIYIIAKWQERGKFKFTIDEFADQYYGDEIRPATWRSTTAQLLRTIGGRLAGEMNGCQLIRSSGIGRGEIGTYEPLGHFRRLMVSADRRA